MGWKAGETDESGRLREAVSAQRGHQEWSLLFLQVVTKERVRGQRARSDGTYEAEQRVSE